MKYRVTIEGRTREVDVEVTPDGRALVAIDGERVDADVVRVGGGVSLRLGGSVYDVAVGGSPDARTIAAGEHRTVAQIESERMRAKRARAGGAGPRDGAIRAPMPGRVVKVLVEVGEEVEAEQPVIVIEAMKMENELRSTAPGKVASIEVAEGQNVEGNTVLVTFE